MLNKKDKIAEYTITFPIKQGLYAQTYRVKDANGKNFFLKLINCAKLNRTQFDNDGKVQELEIVKNLKHPNIAKFHDGGECISEGYKSVYIVFDFIAGETIAQKLVRERTFTVYQAKSIVSSILNGLKYLHSQPIPIIHNELTIQNVMMDMASGLEVPKIIDFGYARYNTQGMDSYMKEGLNPFFIAPESFNGVFSVQSDLFSVGVLLYNLIFGFPAYFTDIPDFVLERNKAIDLIQSQRAKPLRIPDSDLRDLDENLINTICKACANDVEDRFESAEEFIRAINGEIKVENPNLKKKVKEGGDDTRKIERKIPKGEGFAAIAGMQELKDMLRNEVINAIQNAEEYARYGLSLPNGMLLYGPPGCGKTFFAKHFAEEVGFNYMEIKTGQLKSKWVNATQENIVKMFEEAEKNAPTIIFIDEMNELTPNRDAKDVHEMSRSAVNEMLAQMDRTGEKGIFIIGATNYPNMIDPAILRAGRLDKKFYVGPPDKEAREKMFAMYLEKRPYDFGLDYSRLADMTNGYVSADLKLIIDDASLTALKQKSKITQKILEDSIRNTLPSLSTAELKKYDAIRAEMKGEQVKKNERPKIGF